MYFAISTSRVVRGLLVGLLPILSISFFCVAAEVALRLYHLISEGIPFTERSGSNVRKISPYTIDSMLGWRATENYHGGREAKTSMGKSYTVNVSQNQYGFRMFGDIKSPKVKVLTIKDSFTHATEVSDDKAYYAIMQHLLDIEMFAYGIGGAGTLQEFLIFDRYVHVIKPDIVLWQFCLNDFVNNSPELETVSTRNNNGMIRPYWVDGDIVYLLPKGRFAIFREFASSYSRFLAAIIHRFDKLQAVNKNHSVEDDIVRDGFQHPGFLRAIQITDTLMGKVRARTGSIPILSFSCDGGEPYNKAFKQVSSHHDIIFLEGVGEQIQEQANNGLDLYAEDHAHWNENGHRIAGEFLAKLFRDRVSLKPANLMNDNR